MSEKSPNRPRADAPSTLKITVVPGPRAPGVRERIGDIRSKGGRGMSIAVALAIAIAGLAVILVAVAPAGHTPAGHPAEGHPPLGHPLVPPPAQPGPPGGITGPLDPIAQANRFPLRCLIMTVSAADPTYLRAVLNRNNPCSRTSWWVTAILHRVDGMWRAVLVQPYSCPVAGIPAAVQAQLDVCPRSGRVSVTGRDSHLPVG